MIRLKNLLFVTLFCFISTTFFAQRNFNDYNLLGIQGGMTLFNINTSDLVTEQQTGFAAGFTARGAFRNNFDLIYGLTFMSNKVGVFGSQSPSVGVRRQFISYSIPGVQLNFLGSYNIVKHHLSLEFGPLLNINGKMEVESAQLEEYILEGYTTLKAKDIEDISPINFRVMGGLTAGIQNFRFAAQYQYGVTNMLGNLSDNNLEGDEFEGHSSTIVLMAVVYF